MSRLTAMAEWIDARFPMTKMWEEHLSKYYAPKNFNFWYFMGSLALFVLILQIVTGVFLTMHYKPDAERAFASVEYIMRDVPWGWLMRYIHSTGSSMFFVVATTPRTRAHALGDRTVAQAAMMPGLERATEQALELAEPDLAPAARIADDCPA